MAEQPKLYRVIVSFDAYLAPFMVDGDTPEGVVEDWYEALVGRADSVTCISAVPIADEEGDNPVTQPPKTP